MAPTRPASAARRPSSARAGLAPPVTVGVADHAGWAVLVTATADGRMIDRRRVALLGDGLPAMPHHHEAQALPVDEGVALIARVRASAERHANDALATLARDVGASIVGLSVRALPSLPPTVAERVRDYRAQCAADGVMYREVLAAAASARGWTVGFHDARSVLAEAARALGRPSIEPLLDATGRDAGPPWQRDHRLALAAAIALHPAARGR